MRKVTYISLILIMIIILSACGSGSKTISIEDYEWKMRAVMKNDIDTAADTDIVVPAVGEPDDLYPNAKIVDMTLVAKNGKITVTDLTNSKTYSGSYKIMQETPKGKDYEVEIDGLSGYATAAQTQYYEGTEVPTLPINLGEYSIYFIPKD